MNALISLFLLGSFSGGALACSSNAVAPSEGETKHAGAVSRTVPDTFVVATKPSAATSPTVVSSSYELKIKERLLAYAREARINAEPIEFEVPAHPMKYHFIAPNEFDQYVLQPAYGGAGDVKEMKAGGVLISPGTVRALIAAGMGNFSRVIILDLDPIVTEFNRLHVELIREIVRLTSGSRAQRLRYVAALNGLWLNETDLKSIDTIDVLSNSILRSNPDFAVGVEVIVDPEMPENARAVSSELRRLGKAFDQHKFFGFWLYFLRGTEDGLEGVGFDDKKRTVELYWEDDESWKKVADLAMNDRINPINGDFSGEKAVASLSVALKKGGEIVTVFDASNVLQWLSTPEKMRGFIANLRRLPCAENARLVFSALRGGVDALSDSAPVAFSAYKERVRALLELGQHPDDWIYGSATISTFLAWPADMLFDAWLRQRRDFFLY